MNSRTSGLRGRQRSQLSREVNLPEAPLDPEYVRNENLPWQKEAACRNAGGEIFFPKISPGIGFIERQAEAVKLAKQEYCDRCKVREDCGQHASQHEREGIWAGQLLTLENTNSKKRPNGQA